MIGLEGISWRDAEGEMVAQSLRGWRCPNALQLEGETQEVRPLTGLRSQHVQPQVSDPRTNRKVCEF